MTLRLLMQAGLFFELAGAFVLAAPSLSRSSGKRWLLCGTRLPYAITVPIAALLTLTAVTLATWFSSSDFGLFVAWLCMLAVFLSWLGPLQRFIKGGLPEPGRRPTDHEADRLQLTGLGLLSLGFAIQGLTITLP